MKVFLLFISIIWMLSSRPVLGEETAGETKHYAPHAVVELVSLSRIVCDGDDWSYLATLVGSATVKGKPDMILHFGPNVGKNVYNPKVQQFEIFLPDSMQPLFLSRVRKSKHGLYFHYGIRNEQIMVDQGGAFFDEK